MSPRQLARFLGSFLLVFELVQGIVFPQWEKSGAKNHGGSSTKDQPTANKMPMVGDQQRNVSAAPLTISIRKTKVEDLPKVASYLATAASPGDGFRARIDRMFVKDDIEKLLESRYLAIYEAERSWKRLAQQFDMKNQQVDKTLIWRHWWRTNDRLRSTIASAVARTAEPTLFGNGLTMDLTPQPIALQHVQLTAVVVQSSNNNKNNNNNNSPAPIGFCEVAMEPPIGRPLILNVAVDPQYRRRGVARQLLRTAERYVRRHWEIGTSDDAMEESSLGMGLYVDPSNTAALELYKSLGYKKTFVWTANPNADDVPEFEGPRDTPPNRSMVYMFKAFTTVDKNIKQRWAEQDAIAS